MTDVLKTPKSSKRASAITTSHDGEMELKSPDSESFTSPTKKKSSRSKSPGKRKSALYAGGDLLGDDDSPNTPTSQKEMISLSKSPKTPKSPGKNKSKVLEPPNSAPARQSRSKSPGKLKSKRESSVGKQKKERSGSWWNLSDPALMFLPDDSDDEKKLSPEEIKRRNEEVQKFRDKYEQDMRSSVKTGLVSQLLQQAKQKERESKPVVLANIRATPLKIDVSKFEPPLYKRDNEQKALIKETAKKNFILKDFVNTGAKTDIRKLVKAFESVEVKSGTNIVNEGDSGDHFYVIEHGTVEFQVNNKTVRTAGVGSTFGDRNLLYQAPWNETVVASGNGKVLRLHHNTYRGIMQTTEEAKKPLPPPPKKVEKKEDEYAWVVDNAAVQEMNAIKNALTKHTKSSDDLEKIKVLGEGQFGEVWLVATKLPGVAVPKGKTQHEFALKIQNKMGDDEKMVDNIRGEIKAMEELSHPFVSSLYTTYENEDSIDMLLGLIPGGELWDVVHKENEETGEWLSGIPETHAQFYSMVVADTLSFMHTKGYIFRDLKPENIMIDSDGYPVIVDFGFAKKLKPGEKTYTFCGTPNYVAPEIVKNAGHNAAADWWALGIVIYEMISGENPFYYDGLEQMELFESIVEDKPEPLKEGFSKSVVDIVDKFLVKDPEQRLGSGKKKGKEVLNHAFYAGLNLKRLRSRKIKAPWIPGEDKDKNQKAYEAELENERKAAKEAQAREQADDENRRQAEQEEAIRQAEEEARLLAEQKARKQRELDEERQRMVEEERRRKEEELRLQREREEEEERQRLDEEEGLRAQEELRQQKLREEEERKRREEEEQLKREAAEAERLRLEEEERILRESEERRRREEQERLKQEEEERLRQEEEEQRRLEEEERLRLEQEAKERLRLDEEERWRQAELESVKREEEKKERLRLKEEARRRQKEEEKERLRLENEERLKKEAEEKERLRLEKEKQLREEEEEKERLRLEVEERKRQEEEKALRKEERRKQKELEKRIEIEKEMELERQRSSTVAGAGSGSDEELSLDDVFQPNRIANLEESWSEAATSPRRQSIRRVDPAPVPKGYVASLVNGHGKGSTSPSALYSPRVKDELNKSIGKGLVAQRLSLAKAKESGNVPSMFSGFQL